MASLWRNGHLAKTINSLLKNPEVKTITAICNYYNNEQIKIINENIHHNSKVKLIKGNNLKGCDERFKYSKKGTARYIAVCDDDIIYPEGYLKKMIKAANKYKTIISLHGRTLKKERATNFYEHADKMYHCRKELNQDVEVDVLGAGVCLFERSILNIDNLYRLIKYPNMGDIYLSYYAKVKGLKMIVIQHPKEYVQAKPVEDGDNYIYARHRFDCQIQTDFINELFLGYE